MRKLIHSRIMLLSLSAVLITALLCTAVCYRAYCAEVMDELSKYTHLLAENELTTDTLLGDQDLLMQYADRLADSNFRITLISADGEVLFDNTADAAELDNHRTREEIEAAFREGEGRSIRRSGTIHRTNFYCAVRMPDGRILRTARESSSIFTIFSHVFPVILLICLAILILCWLVSRFLTARILRPIENISLRLTSLDDHHADGFAGNDKTPAAGASGPAESSLPAAGNDADTTYPELEPIVSRIREQHQEIISGAQMRQEFTANVSHELKTPLTAISGYAQLIESGMADEADSRRFAGEIRRGSDRLQTLINDILRLSELDSRTADLSSPENVDLYQEAITCVDMLEPVCERAGVTMTITGTHSVVRADRIMAGELIYNLCDNAIRYNREGGSVTVDVRDGVISVSDTGIGIPEEYRERVFERFFRVDKSRSKKTGGTGLGLAIVKHIAEKHHAVIHLDSTPGAGTRITVAFPEAGPQS